MVVVVLVMIVVMMMLLLMIVMVAAVVMIVVIIVVVIVVMMAVLVIVLLMLIVAMMVVFMLMLIGLMLGTHLLQHLVGQRHLLHGGQNGLAVDLIPRGGDDGGGGVLLPQHGCGGLQLLLTQLLGTAEDDGAGGLDLVIIELAEVLHVDLHLAGIGHGDKAVQLHVRHVLHGVLHRHDHVGELAYAGGLDEDAVGLELLVHFLQRLVEVAHQRAADAAGGHLADLHAAVLQKAAVNGDLAELVFNQHQLFALIGLGQQLLDERGLACAKESGDNVDFCHSIPFFSSAVESSIYFFSYIISFFEKNASLWEKVIVAKR